jgi:hypothetical protein
VSLRKKRPDHLFGTPAKFRIETLMLEPKIEFTPWVAWKKLPTTLKAKNGQLSPGVYLWAHFHQAPDPTDIPAVSNLPKAIRRTEANESPQPAATD